MSWIGIVVLVLGVWLALKVAGVLFKLLLWAVAVVAVYWFAAPYLGLPWPF
ncbi:hypothetical protein [Thermomonas paludicola]|uniref:hypothetical protein n=1 Tax=Thermomonas paludicola TaxID=2884874 RepID=UPI002115C9CA|nr:hypothetical protein [Thermomonas paludicola]